MRTLAWLLVVLLAMAGRWRRDDVLSLAALGLALILFFWLAPRALRPSVAGLAGAIVALFLFFGAEVALAAAPALFCAFVAWMFARSLLARRRPLIGRAMVAVDGESIASQPVMIAYARRLTLVWAVWLGLWAAAAALPLLLDYGAIMRLVTLAMPFAVALLFVAEFALRPLLLPNAPRHRFIEFLMRVARSWPTLLDDNAPK